MTGYKSPELLTIKEAAVRLKCHKQTVRKMVKDKDLPSIELGGIKRIPSQAIDEMISESIKNKKDSENGSREVAEA